jgi:NAD(P)H dehydrogenase (quinone)
MKFVITGATGRTSRMIADNLLARGVAGADIIMASRSPERAELAPYAARGADLRYCDFTDLPSVAPALAGGDRMYLMPMNHPPGMVDEAAVKSAVVAEAKSAGIRFCVYQSFIAAAAGDPSDDDLVTENALKASGMGWTILRTGVFTESLGRECKRYIQDGRIPCHAPEASRAYVTRDDIAAAGAAVLLDAGHAGRTYNIIGSTLNMEELAALLTDIAGKPVVTVPAAGRAFGGNLDPPPSDLAALIGRPPITVEDQFRSDRQELLTGVPVGAEVKFGFQWQARGMETRPDDLGLTMLRLFAAAHDGDGEARARFRTALAGNPERHALWRRTHPEWFAWDETSGVK